MHSFFGRSLLSLVLLAALLASTAQSSPQNGGDFSHNSEAKPLPANTILVRGAWASASDSETPLPERGTLAENTYINKYFGLAYALPSGWTQKYSGPPPSDSGYYVLAQLRPGDANRTTGAGSILITAQDLFFTLMPATNAFELLTQTEQGLQSDYKIKRSVTPVSIANHSFVRFDYFSPAAGLHWLVLATQIRCHQVQFVFTSGDTKLLESLVQQMEQIKLPAEASPILGTGGDGVPVCIKEFARPENLIETADPVFTEHRSNAIPVRIIIGKDGTVKHIHFLSAFPDQAKSITDALSQWRFKPYLRDGQALEVETGILFGGVPQATAPAATGDLNQ